LNASGAGIIQADASTHPAVQRLAVELHGHRDLLHATEVQCAQRLRVGLCGNIGKEGGYRISRAKR
jgi:hypothetical protein